MSKPTDGFVIYNAEGEPVGRGTGAAVLQPGESLQYELNPAEAPGAIQMAEAKALRRQRANVEVWKTDQEYAGKSENAIRWLKNNPALIGDPPLILRTLATLLQIEAHDVGDYTAELYPWMYLEIDARGITPRECAEEIVAAIKRQEEADLGAWEKARRRIALREELRAQE